MNSKWMLSWNIGKDYKVHHIRHKEPTAFISKITFFNDWIDFIKLFCKASNIIFVCRTFPHSVYHTLVFNALSLNYLKLWNVVFNDISMVINIQLAFSRVSIHPFIEPPSLSLHWAPCMSKVRGWQESYLFVISNLVVSFQDFTDCNFLSFMAQFIFIDAGSGSAGSLEVRGNYMLLSALK